MRISVFPFILLMGCNPEHNPADLAAIEGLKADCAKVSSSAAAQAEQISIMETDAEAMRFQFQDWKVVGRAFMAATKQSGNTLVVCHPLASPMDGDGMIQVKTQTMPTTPWIQTEVTADCGAATVFDLTAEVVEPLAQVNSGDQQLTEGGQTEDFE